MDCATLSLLDDQIAQAVAWLQEMQTWKNHWESASSHFLPMLPEHWVTMSACSCAAGDDDSAASFAIQAWNAADQQWSADLFYDFRDSRADAAVLLAACRFRQRRPDRAVALLEQAVDEHRQSGDIEQLTADYLFLFLCEDAAGRADRAMQALLEARDLLNESLDDTRHARRSALMRWCRRYGQARPSLMRIR